MGKWLCVMEQASDGCDYSIGCGSRTMLLEADSKDAAFSEVLRKWYLDEADDYEPLAVYGPGEEWQLSQFVLYEIGATHDLMPLVWEAAEKKKHAEAAIEEKRERQRFEELQKKYGKEASR